MNISIRTLGFSALFALCATTCHAETSSLVIQPLSRGEILGDSIRHIPDDVAKIFTFPVDHPDESKTAALVVGALVLFDKPITKFYQNHIETPLSGFSLPNSPLQGKTTGSGAITNGADGWLLLGVGGTYLGGLALGDETAQMAGLQSVKALTYSYVVSQLLLKSITGRKRPISWSQGGKPDGVFTDNPYQFGNIHAPRPNAAADSTAMPSLHFTAFFAVAKVYQRAYDDYWVPYTLATVGLASNIQGHKHWVSDMTAGALIGTAIGMAVTDDYFSDAKGIKIAPYIDTTGSGLQLTARY